jgi:type II secretion system protein H
MRRDRPRSAFTLIELMAAITLMTLAVSIAVFRLDGLSAATRIESVARRMMSTVELARTEARTTGRPRRIEYPIGAARVSVRRPERSGGTWSWGDAIFSPPDKEVNVDRVLVEGTESGAGDSDVIAIVVRPGGRHRSHAVVLRCGERFAAVFLESAIADRFVLWDRRPQALSFELLVMEASVDLDAN